MIMILNAVATNTVSSGLEIKENKIQQNGIR